MNKNLIALIALLMALAMSHNTIRAATITWSNTSGGNWSVPANWNPHQVPTNTDNALITIPGTYTVTLDGYGSVANLTLGAGGGASGTQTFAVTSQILVVTNSLLLTGGGVLKASGDNATLTVAVTVVNDGVLNLAAGYQNCSFSLDSLIVTNGGMFTAGGRPNYGTYYGSTFVGTATVANGGVFTANGAWPGAVITVAQGGVLNIITNGLYLIEPLANFGTINLTNTVMNFDNIPHAYYGSLVNQPGGVINVQGSSTIGNGSGFFINQGTLIESTGPGTTLNFDDYFDNSQGTVTNLAGTLVLGTYQTNLAGTYYAAAGATNQFIAANNATPVTPGAPFVLAGSGQYQFIAGFLALTNKTYSNLALIADSLVLGPAFQGGAITNLALAGIGLSNSLPVAGILTATNGGIDGNFTIASGGAFTESNSATYGKVTVANGGVINASGGLIFDDYNNSGGGWVVAHGGVVNLSGTVNVWSTLTNAGTVNISTATVSLFANPQGGIVNQAGGVLNFLGGGSSISYNYGPEYFINRGAVVQNSSGVTNTITMLDFDTSQGTVTNLAGTLLLGYFQTNLTGTYFTAGGATIQFVGGTAASPVSPGTPLVLGGSGSYQFISDLVSLGTHGYLYLPTSVIPNLSMQGGLLELGPNFQGGAITNLTLNGIALTNQLATTLPITGTFTVLNSGGVVHNYGGQLIYTGVYGDYTLMNGGLLTVSNSFMRGAVTVAGGGIMNMMGASMFGPVTVAGGGLITVTGRGGVIYPSSILLIAAGGTMNLTGSGINLDGPLNNAGTINITNAAPAFASGLFSYNDGFGNYLGGITNRMSGLINLGGDSTYLSANGGGYEYIVNQGRIIKSAGTNLSSLLVPCLTNSGAITIQSGVFYMKPFVTLPGGSLNVGLNSATNYGSFQIASDPYDNNPVTNILLAGVFNATLNNGYVPVNGTSFSVVSIVSPDTYSGNFTSLGLPSAVSWQSNYGSTNFTLVAGSSSPEFGGIHLAGTNLIFNGTGGMSGSNYVVLMSTNLALPLASWTALTTNKFDVNGQFQYTNHINPAKPRQFFIFKLP